MPALEASSWVLQERDLVTQTLRGSGAGGQHRNKTESAVRMQHIPTGLEVCICTQRSQHQNRRIARELLEGRVAALRQDALVRARGTERRALAGSGARAEKIRTYRVKDGIVTDHRTGQKAAFSRVMGGELSLLW